MKAFSSDTTSCDGVGRGETYTKTLGSDTTSYKRKLIISKLLVAVSML
jgi:hypothetical protein